VPGGPAFERRCKRFTDREANVILPRMGDCDSCRGSTFPATGALRFAPPAITAAQAVARTAV